MQVTLFASWVLPLKTDSCVANRVDKDIKQIVIELSEDLAQQVRPYQNRLEELVLLGLSQLKIQEALTCTRVALYLLHVQPKLPAVHGLR